MKVSSVLRGIGKLLQVLHPPLPLSTKESLRLQNVLTATFRKHLDEAHPQRASDHSNALTTGSIPASSKSSETPSRLHASAVASADRHMTSVLTNPLLMGQLTPESGIRESQDQPRGHADASHHDQTSRHSETKPSDQSAGGSQRYRAKHLDTRNQPSEKQAQLLAVVGQTLMDSPSLTPSSLLRRCLVQSPKNIDLIEAVVKHIELTISNLAFPKQEQALADMDLAQDFLNWLGSHGAREPRLYSAGLVTFIVHCLSLQGMDSAVWNWISLPITITTLDQARQHEPSTMWRARVLLSLVNAKLGIVVRDSDNDARAGKLTEQTPLLDAQRCNAALSVVSKAFELEACRENFILTRPVLRLSRFLSKKFTIPASVDLIIYDKVIHAVHAHKWREATRLKMEHAIACLELARHTTPSATTALKHLKQYHSSSPSGIYAVTLQQRKLQPAKVKWAADNHQIIFMARTAFVLWQHGQKAEAVWVVSTLRDTYAGHPGLAVVEAFWSGWHAASSKEGTNAARLATPADELPIVKDLACWQSDHLHPVKAQGQHISTSLFEQLLNFKPSPDSFAELRRRVHVELRQRLGQSEVRAVSHISP